MVECCLVQNNIFMFLEGFAIWRIHIGHNQVQSTIKIIHELTFDTQSVELNITL